MCVFGGGGGGGGVEGEREGYGWVNKIVQKGYSSEGSEGRNSQIAKSVLEQACSLNQFLNKHVNYS